MCENEKCECESCDTENANVRTISVEGAPKELVSLVDAVVKVATDYPLAVSGVKKRARESRKTLMEIKNLAHEMRKIANESTKKDAQ